MKKFYSFMLMACAMLVSANVWATDVADFAGLKTALAQGGEITLTASVDAGSEQLTITKGVVINGNGNYVKGTNTYVFQVNTADQVVMNNLVIYAAKTSKQGRGILIDDNTNNAKLDLNNVTINCTYRAMDVWYSDNVTLNINDCLFQNVQGQTVGANGNPTSANYDIELKSGNASDTRGLNFGQLPHSNITINNTTMQGFFYVLNNVTGDNGDMTGTTLVANNSTFKGRAALNVWGFGATYEFNDCTVLGINNYGGGQEGFSCFVMNNQSTCHDNTLTINGGTVVSVAFDAVGGSNPNANQYMIDDRATNNTFVINNAQYTCTKDLGNDKGGIFYRTNPTTVATINGGIYDCPNIVAYTISNGGNIGSLVINGGTFDVEVIALGIADDGDVYKTIEINGGNFTVADTEHGIDAELDGEKLLAEGMDVNTNVDGSTTAMPAEEVANVKTVDDIEGDADAYQLQVAAGKTLTVADGETVVIGEGGIILEDATSQIKVEEGGKLVLNGDINGTKDENSIVINTSEANTAALYINPAVNVYGAEHPKGTINLISKAYTISEGNYVWQRFGIPTFDGNVTMTWDGTATWIKKADTQTETYTNVLSNATSGNETFTDLVPFASYTMNSDHAAPGAVYTFTGNLMGNQDAELNMIKGASGWNYFANSYTAPIDIYAMLQTLKANYGDNVSVTVYVYQKAGNTWDVINLADMELAALGISEAPQTVINPMQAFILYLYNGTEAQAKINYNDDVFAPATTAAAPRRVVATNVNNAIRFTVANSLYTDNATIIEGANFSDNFDNGYDAQKYMNEANFNLYAVTAEGEMATVATNDIEGTRLAFNAAQAGNYTLTFNTNAANYALKDNATNAVINIENGATYSFNAEAGVNEARFTVIGRADAPTALENTNATVKRAGIYTLTGQYLGETSMFNTLPQGVYVVDGKKVVR